jgi:hypothetical protein
VLVGLPICSPEVSPGLLGRVVEERAECSSEPFGRVVANGVEGSREGLSETFSGGAGRAIETVGTASLEGRDGPRRGVVGDPSEGWCEQRVETFWETFREAAKAAHGQPLRRPSRTLETTFLRPRAAA